MKFTEQEMLDIFLEEEGEDLKEYNRVYCCPKTIEEKYKSMQYELKEQLKIIMDESRLGRKEMAADIGVTDVTLRLFLSDQIISFQPLIKIEKFINDYNSK